MIYHMIEQASSANNKENAASKQQPQAQGLSPQPTAASRRLFSEDPKEDKEPVKSVIQSFVGLSISSSCFVDENICQYHRGDYGVALASLVLPQTA